jgi:hypothetical protein
MTVSMVQLHRHTDACRKLPSGATHCRFSYPRANREQTSPVELVPYMSENETAIGFKAALKDTYSVVETDKIAKLPYFALSEYGKNTVQPFSPPDKRILVWEIRNTQIKLVKKASKDEVQRMGNLVLINDDPNCQVPHLLLDGVRYFDFPELDKIKNTANGNVVTYNSLLTAVAGCNTACYFLGSAEQAKAAFFYCVKYVNKDGVGLASAASAMLAALNALQFENKRQLQIESKEGKETLNVDNDDTNVLQTEEEKRKKRDEKDFGLRKKVANMLVNQLQGGIEVASQQAASAVLGYEPQNATHTFWQLYSNSAKQFVLQQYKQQQINTQDSNECDEPDYSTENPSSSKRKAEEQKDMSITPEVEFEPTKIIEQYQLYQNIDDHPPNDDEPPAPVETFLIMANQLEDRAAFDGVHSQTDHNRSLLQQANLANQLNQNGYNDVEEDEDDILAGGFGSIAHDEHGKITGVVAQANTYACRGIQLSHLSLYEFTCGITLVPILEGKKKQNNKSSDEYFSEEENDNEIDDDDEDGIATDGEDTEESRKDVNKDKTTNTPKKNTSGKKKGRGFNATYALDKGKTTLLAFHLQPLPISLRKLYIWTVY